MGRFRGNFKTFIISSAHYFCFKFAPMPATMYKKSTNPDTPNISCLSIKHPSFDFLVDKEEVDFVDLPVINAFKIVCSYSQHVTALTTTTGDASAGFAKLFVHLCPDVA
jgi:hypothetical protein